MLYLNSFLYLAPSVVTYNVFLIIWYFEIYSGSNDKLIVSSREYFPATVRTTSTLEVESNNGPNRYSESSTKWSLGIL